MTTSWAPTCMGLHSLEIPSWPIFCWRGLSANRWLRGRNPTSMRYARSDCPPSAANNRFPDREEAGVDEALHESGGKRTVIRWSSDVQVIPSFDGQVSPYRHHEFRGGARHGEFVDLRAPLAWVAWHCGPRASACAAGCRPGAEPRSPSSI